MSKRQMNFKNDPDFWMAYGSWQRRLAPLMAV